MILIHGDNLEALSDLRSSCEGRVTLAYLDPPFLTGREHRTTDGRIAFDDRWPSRGAYLASLGERIALVRALLAPHGSMVVHVDPKTSHYVKVLCDEIFGDDAFASEIVWRYRRWPSKTRNFQRMHDVLLRYRKDPKISPRWNQLYEAPAASTLETWGTAKQRAVVDGDGQRVRSSSMTEESPGVPLGDVWEISVIAPVARERTGYPTQKPLALLERLILALSDPGDLVLDPFCGSGTTLAAAVAHGRRSIGIDSSAVAIEVVQRRLDVEVTRVA